MMNPRRIELALIMFAVLSFPVIASAQFCVAYAEEGPIECSGTNPECSSSYIKTICDFGCTSGTCSESSGNTGRCCDDLYHNSQIYPDGERRCQGDCPPPTRAFTASDLKKANIFKEALKALELRQKLYEIAYVPSSCTLSYEIVIRRTFLADGETE